MGVALIVFLLGTTTYRFHEYSEENPFLRIGRVFVAAFENRRTPHSEIPAAEESQGLLPHQGAQQFKFLHKALIVADGSQVDGKLCSTHEVEEAKAVIRVVPILVTTLACAIVFSQPSTLFTKLQLTGPSLLTLQVPSATLQSFINLSIIIFIPMYDCILVPIARAVTGKPSSLTILHRIGTGMLLSLLSMVIATLVEIKHLETAREHGVVDKPNVTIPMSVCWLIPQYLLFGISDVFTMVGLLQFFYDQVPSELRSVGLAPYLSIFGIGSLLSSFLISIIESATGA